MLNFERVFTLFLAGVGGYAAYLASGFKAPVYPTTLGVILCVCSLILFAKTFTKKARAAGNQAEKQKKLTGEQLRVIITILLTLIYIVLIKPVGFVVASILFTSIVMWTLEFRKPGVILLVSIPFNVGIYLFFTRIVHISLPSGILPF